MTIHLPEDLEVSLLAEVSRGRFASLDEAIAEAARLLLRQTHPLRKGAADTSVFEALDRTGLVGCLDGPPGSPTDLSTNPAHMEGFGRG